MYVKRNDLIYCGVDDNQRNHTYANCFHPRKLTRNLKIGWNMNWIIERHFNALFGSQTVKSPIWRKNKSTSMKLQLTNKINKQIQKNMFPMRNRTFITWISRLINNLSKKLFLASSFCTFISNAARSFSGEKLQYENSVISMFCGKEIQKRPAQDIIWNSGPNFDGTRFRKSSRIGRTG